MEQHINNKDLFKQFKQAAISNTNLEDFAQAFPFYIMKIFFRDFTDDEIEQAIEGLHVNDESIDAFWKNDKDKMACIAQFKSCENEKNLHPAQKDWLDKLLRAPEKLKDFDITEKHKNTRIRDIAQEYEECIKQGYGTKLYLFHLGLPHKKPAYSKGIIYYGWEEIQEQWQDFDSANSITAPAQCYINVNYDSEVQCIKHRPTSKYKTFVTLLTGLELVELREKYRYALFDRNIRYYLGNTNPVNEHIIDTAKQEPSNFYYFNNGITISCTECVGPVEKNGAIRLTLTYPQIINGAQTINSLYAAYKSLEKQLNYDYKKLQEHFKKINVLCRIIESTKHTDTNFALKLTRYNNSQSKVIMSDFCSNRPEQMELQKKLALYGYFYEIKRGEVETLTKENYKNLGIKGKSDIKKITMTFLASCFLAYNQEPWKFTNKEIFDPEIAEYKSIFGDKKSDITPEKVKNIVLAINIFKSVSDCSKTYNSLVRQLTDIKKNPKDNNKDKEKLKKTIEDAKFMRVLVIDS